MKLLFPLLKQVVYYIFLLKVLRGLLSLQGWYCSKEANSTNGFSESGNIKYEIVINPNTIKIFFTAFGF